MKQEEDGALRSRKEEDKAERPLWQKSSGQIEKKKKTNQKHRQEREEGPDIDQMATGHHSI